MPAPREKRICPVASVQTSLQLRGGIELDTVSCGHSCTADKIGSSLKRGSLHQEDGVDHIGEGGGEVDHLAAGMDAIEEAEEVEKPDGKNAKHQPPGRAASKIHEIRRHPPGEPS